MSSLKILSGGAAQGLIASLTPAFKARTGFEIEGEFGAVGAMADKLLKGVPADLIILTAALVAKLAVERQVVSSSIADIGQVETALAVRKGDPSLTVAAVDGLRKALLAADAIFVPDTNASTAGIHVAKLLAQLGIADEVAARLKVFPNGATAMRELAVSDARRPVGCTQSTEIIAAEGVELSGPLPPGYELRTMYTAGVTTNAAHAEQALALIELLTGAGAGETRHRVGFV
jgi:molybdate transport system substrate-binding protein